MKEYDLISFVQITTIQEAHDINVKYKNNMNNIIFKVTMHPRFYNLVEELKSFKYKIAATTIYDIIQINQAIEMNLDYTMVYKGKNEYNGLFSDARKIKTLTNSNISLVGASFRDKHQVKEAITSGMDYSTISTNIMNIVFENEQLSSDIHQLYD